jgi:hypothetical protein
VVTRADEYLVALDLGTSGLKVAVTTPRGEIAGSVQEQYPLHVLGGGGVEQDPEDWWRAITRGTRRVLGSSGVDPARVVGVACSSQWSGTVPVDERGRPLMRAIIWMDSRGAEQVHRITRGFPAVQGYGVGKLAAWVRRSGGAPGHSGKDTVAHILYVRDRLPDITLVVDAGLGAPSHAAPPIPAADAPMGAAVVRPPPAQPPTVTALSEELLERTPGTSLCELLPAKRSLGLPSLVAGVALVVAAAVVFTAIAGGSVPKGLHGLAAVSDERAYVPGEVLVSFRRQPSPGELRASMVDIEALKERILGRTLANDLLHPETQDVLYLAGSLPSVGGWRRTWRRRSARRR